MLLFMLLVKLLERLLDSLLDSLPDSAPDSLPDPDPVSLLDSPPDSLPGIETKEFGVGEPWPVPPSAVSSSASEVCAAVSACDFSRLR